jgi:dynactin complex subunit
VVLLPILADLCLRLEKLTGVMLDEPKGKNNGTVEGNLYFQVWILVCVTGFSCC